jgi:hypothetical protein
MKPNSALDRGVYWIAGVGPWLALALATVEGFLRGGYDWVAEPISALALGPRGWIQQLDFALLVASFASFAFVLRSQFRRGAAAVAAIAVTLLMTAGLTLSGIFTMDAPGALPTLAGQLHLAGGFLIFPWTPVLLFIAARLFQRDARWRPYFELTLATGLLSAATIAFFLLFVGPPEFPRPLAAWTGVVQRFQLVQFFAWTALVTRRAYVGTEETSAAVQANDAVV